MSIRAKRKGRSQVRRLRKQSIMVNRTNQHTYAMLVDEAGRIVTSLSTLTPAIKKKIKTGSNCEAAHLLGVEMAKVVLKKGIKALAFDRNGFRYHGRVKAVAEGAREGGVEF